MPFLRDTVLSLMPKAWAVSAEADSKLWRTDCMSCGHQSNVWELGGMRWKAYGRPMTSFRCLGCGKVKMHRIHKP